MLSDCELPPLLQPFKRIDASLMTPDEVINAIARTLGVETEPLPPQPDGRPVSDPVLPITPVTAVQASDELNPTEVLIANWLSFVEEKWRTVSDSQLGWKPLRGRWNGWEEIYDDVFLPEEVDDTARRFELSQYKGSSAAAVASFLHDLQCLRNVIERKSLPVGHRVTKKPIIRNPIARSPIIRNPMIVDADDQ
jgi:hypothetical protein